MSVVEISEWFELFLNDEGYSLIGVEEDLKRPGVFVVTMRKTGGGGLDGFSE